MKRESLFIILFATVIILLVFSSLLKDGNISALPLIPRVIDMTPKGIRISPNDASFEPCFTLSC